MALIGYARISTGDQTLDWQRDALREAGCLDIYEEQASGARNGLQPMRQGGVNALLLLTDVETNEDGWL